MDYEIRFDSKIDPSVVKQAVIERWGLAPDTVFAGSWPVWQGSAWHVGKPIVLIHTGSRPGNPFDTKLHAGAEFAEACGSLDELTIATILCRKLKTRAIIDDDGWSDLTWMLVTEDGWHGRVVIDEEALDEEHFKIAYALQPVPVAPEIPVEDPGEWDYTHYEDGKIPDSGYLDFSE